MSSDQTPSGEQPTAPEARPSAPTAPDQMMNREWRIAMIAAMKKALADLRGAELLDGCGHWTQQERPVEVSERLLSWLAEL